MNFSKSKDRQNSIRIIDVKKGLSLAIICAFLSIHTLNAQTTPEPPTPPQTNTTSGTSYSISIDNDDDETSNSSISIKTTDEYYKFRASFHKSKNERVKSMIIKNLGNNNLKVEGNTYLWTDSKNGDEVFECKLTKGHLRMSLDSEVASQGFTQKITELGRELKYFISGTDRKKEELKKAERAKRDLERAQRDLERAKRDLERTERDAKRAKGN
ncbi:hypothetical protein [Psychroserpens luteolus]|uniref:hypothetical protein n=1 Tax=Psychroserpens luteolus TaxID=2855840 RepID=UPI001E4ECE40|nr:hypothetical protein [Psychroserpens luteolus]MCD2258166.1 hypothetical protein [Psychroserpens luteolus]